MDNNISFGSGSNIVGGVDSLKQAMARRGIDASILDQVTPASGTPSPVAQGIPQTNPNIGTTDQQVASQAVPGVPATQNPNEGFRSEEMSIALRAMEGVIKTENQIVKSTLKLQGIS